MVSTPCLLYTSLLAVAAARQAAAGHDYRQVAEYVRELAPRMRVVFVVDTLEYLHKGGRIGGAKRLVGSVLSIKPLLHIENGQICLLYTSRCV